MSDSEKTKGGEGLRDIEDLTPEHNIPTFNSRVEFFGKALLAIYSVGLEGVQLAVLEELVGDIVARYNEFFSKNGFFAIFVEDSGKPLHISVGLSVEQSMLDSETRRGIVDSIDLFYQSLVADEELHGLQSALAEVQATLDRCGSDSDEYIRHVYQVNSHYNCDFVAQQLGDLEVSRGNFHSAADHYRKAIKLAPASSYRSQGSLAVLLSHMAAQKDPSNDAGEIDLLIAEAEAILSKMNDIDMYSDEYAFYPYALCHYYYNIREFDNCRDVINLIINNYFDELIGLGFPPAVKVELLRVRSMAAVNAELQKLTKLSLTNVSWHNHQEFNSQLLAFVDYNPANKDQ